MTMAVRPVGDVLCYWCMLLPFIEGGTIKANNTVRCREPQIVMSRKAKFNFINILTQNARGIKSAKRIDELSDQMLKHNTFALCLSLIHI